MAEDRKIAELPVIDMDVFLRRGESADMEAAAQAECKRAADALKTFGTLAVKDGRVSQKDNDT